MTAFRVAAIPTRYRGRLYRSRLEAKWAAFFDMLGLRHEYEPFDLGAWSPDFLLRSASVAHTGSVLAEVKPITEFSQDAADKVAGAVLESGSGGEETPIAILLGLKPVWNGDPMSPVIMGWVHGQDNEEQEWAWEPIPLGWIKNPHEPRFDPDFISTYKGIALGYLGLHAWIESGSCRNLRAHLRYQEHAMSLWARATNAVQWLGKEQQP